MTMRGEQILSRAIEIQKENWGKPRFFFIDSEATIILKNSKIELMYGDVFEIEALLSLKIAWLPPNFLFGYQEHLPSSAFSAYF